MISWVIVCILNFSLQGSDGVDLEMNLNGSMSRAEDDEFIDVVCSSTLESVAS